MQLLYGINCSGPTGVQRLAQGRFSRTGPAVTRREPDKPRNHTVQSCRFIHVSVSCLVHVAPFLLTGAPLYSVFGLLPSSARRRPRFKMKSVWQPCDKTDQRDFSLRCRRNLKTGKTKEFHLFNSDLPPLPPPPKYFNSSPLCKYK